MSEKKGCFFFSILPTWSNFIFTATISVYQLINPINMGVCKTEITSEAQCWVPVRKPFLQMTLQ